MCQPPQRLLVHTDLLNIVRFNKVPDGDGDDERERGRQRDVKNGERYRELENERGRE